MPVAPDEIKVDQEIHLQRLRPPQADLLANTICENIDFIGQWETWAYKVTKESLRQKLESQEELTSQGLYAGYGIYIQDKLCGFTNMYNREDDEALIGYWRIKAAEGLGVTTRAVRALTRTCFDSLGIKSLYFDILLGNTPSMKLAGRLGAKPIFQCDRSSIVRLALPKN